MKRSSTLIVIAVIVLGSLAPQAIESADADSIYLKNGRVIRAQGVRVEGNRVVFVLYGGEQAIPVALIDRVERDDWNKPAPPRAASTAGTNTVASGGAGAGSSPTSGTALAATSDPAQRMQALSQMFGNVGGDGVDATQALNLLQTLGSMQGSGDAGGLAALAPALGALAGGDAGGGLLGALGDLGSLGSDLETIQVILPALSRLGAALFAPEYSEETTNAAARELLASLQGAGVSQAEIREYAKRFGVPDSVLDQIR